ncbi:hypothetical protein BpHYR1_024502 [Brachionus plicatilis]|uniref:Uncharacterized protein n=1 Tax=Brachionus plicatilis TaxID=10195 RepID=A0A3M7R2G1_BRAPC|nr:hypothetical protein BpHYR1_024502 [Brachionus plicatilis]
MYADDTKIFSQTVSEISTAKLQSDLFTVLLRKTVFTKFTGFYVISRKIPGNYLIINNEQKAEKKFFNYTHPNIIQWAGILFKGATNFVVRNR